MKIALIGATGYVGSTILMEALSRGHQVLAILRHPEKLKLQNKNLSVVQGDVMDSEKLASLLKGNEIVISAYNSGWSNPDIYNEFIRGSRSIQEGVKKSGVKRLIVMGGAGSLFIKPGVQLIDTPGVPEFAKAGSQAARDYLNILKKDDQVRVQGQVNTEQDRTARYLTPAIRAVFRLKISR